MGSWAIHYAPTAEAVLEEGGSVHHYDLRHNVECGAGDYVAVLASQYPHHVDCGRCVKTTGFRAHAPQSIETEQS